VNVLLPDGWPRPKGYANGIAVDAGRLVFVAGVIAWDENHIFTADTLVGQLRQVLLNTRAIMAEADAGPEHMVRMTWYITDKSEYASQAREIGAVYREIMGKYYPAMACVQVAALMADDAKIEIETTCVVP
jgi:enamine deaminase RidA (YjgF/YER057c/UK114 family)